MPLMESLAKANLVVLLPKWVMLCRCFSLKLSRRFRPGAGVSAESGLAESVPGGCVGVSVSVWIGEQLLSIRCACSSSGPLSERMRLSVEGVVSAVDLESIEKLRENN